VKAGGLVFRSANNADGYHDTVRFNWEMVPAAGGGRLRLPRARRRRPYPVRLSGPRYAAGGVIRQARRDVHAPSSHASSPPPVLA
jgi:hypothetical protein